MAVKTKLTESDIASIILNYEIGDLIDFEGFTEGVENTNYLIITSEDKFVLTIFEERVKTADLPFYESLLDHLYQNHINIPYFIPNKFNNSFFTFNSKRGVIIPFFNGKAKLTNHNEADLFKLGQYLAKFHKASSNFSKRRENPFNLDNCHKLYMNMYMRNHLTDEEHRFLRSCFEQILKNNIELPTGIIHADLFPDNVFFINNNIEAIIDPYFSCFDILIYDVAICASAWCFDDENIFNGNLVMSLLKGYNSVRTLTENEIIKFRDFCLLATIRFFFTRLEDSFKIAEIEEINEKDPGEFYERVEFFYNWKGLTRK